MKIRRVSSILVISLALVSAALLGCESTNTNIADSNTAEGMYQIAQNLEKDELYREAIDRYNTVKNKFPYSKFAVAAKLAVANLHYKTESYIEAQAAYETFKDLHPKHEQIAFATYRLAMSYKMQLPTTDDRDLSLARNAILYFDEVSNNYPESEYAKESQANRIEIRKRLALKELYIADYYKKQEQYLSALGRFENVLKKFGSTGFDSRALYGAVSCAFKVGQHEKGKTYYEQLAQRFPDSREARDAGREFEQYVSQ